MARIEPEGERKTFLTPIGVVLNRQARANRLHPRRSQPLSRLLGRYGKVWETESVEELRLALQELVREGPGCLVSGGGDGTFHWMMNELWSMRSQHGGFAGIPPIVPTRSGAMNFVAKKLAVQGPIEQTLAGLVRSAENGLPRRVDWLDGFCLEGDLRETDERVVRFRRIGFAAAIGGIGRRFFEKYNRARDGGSSAVVRIVLGGVGSQALRLFPSRFLRRLQEYSERLFAPTTARVAIDGRLVPSREHGAIHAGAFPLALGPFFRVFPLAQTGRIHFQAGSISPWEIVRNLPNLYRGQTIRSEGLWDRDAREMTVEAVGQELLSPVIDGEIFTGLERLTIRPGPAVPVIGPIP